MEKCHKCGENKIIQGENKIIQISIFFHILLIKKVVKKVQSM
jgi:hypothetical protein